MQSDSGERRIRTSSNRLDDSNLEPNLEFPQHDPSVSVAIQGHFGTSTPLVERDNRETPTVVINLPTHRRSSSYGVDEAREDAFSLLSN